MALAGSQMSRGTQQRRLPLPWIRGSAVLAVTICLAALLVPISVSAWDYSSPKIDFLGEEAMRLINLDRSGNGKATLYSDPKLINLARDLAWTCPSNSSMTIRGRARDMIDRGYFSHYIKGCYKSGTTEYSIIDILKIKFGYSYGRAEIIAGNYYGVSGTSYKWGCDASGAYCNGTTGTPKTVASVEYWWMHDTSHRNIILGDYDRFGCAMWRGSDGKNIFVCDFAKTGPNPLDTTHPTVTNVTGNGATVKQGSTITLSAKLSDNIRLAEGWVRLNPTSTCGGPMTLSAWAYNLNIVSETHSFTWNTTGVAPGTYAIGWRTRDVSTLGSACVIIHVTVQ